MIDYKAFYKISYGLYIVSSGDKYKGNAYISNTVFQVTSEPAQFASCCNKDNFTSGIIEKTGAFAVSILHTDATPSTYGTFGYKSGRDMNKFDGMIIKYGQTGVPIVLNDSMAFIECKVVKQIDLGTHIMFIGEVVQSEILDDTKELMTYAYYREVKNGVAPKNAPTYIDKSKLESPSKTETKKARHQCFMCGYVYDDADEEIPFDELPDDWTCPACGVGKEEFFEIN
jgi:flavin reductase (DIM6/NTAB) family NADH-FMN oxidoreductase RutF/rubredoxin